MRIGHSFYIYDCTITFPREVELFWGHPFTGASLLFLLNKYLYLAILVVDVCNFASMSDKAIGTLPYFVWALYSSMRAYALSRRHRILSATILVLSLVPMGINYAQYRWLIPINDPIIGCIGNLTQAVSLAKQCA
uniref:Probable 3-oxoacyl-[acyl-carrier-protein] reductase oxidoreductase (EC) n=1 Tax=Ganoderma boninense TaxID=34458 RepID=A0A5K1K673_9APHY|nr:Probable 3-oxoacyl-[acyl-carrier-protein] reductase oxidoreductase (EC [Ganoderma boninense]